MTDADLLVVGAGAAGLAAAKAARAAGARVVVLEAASRIGGRAETRLTAGGHPWDTGAHWMHHAERNPFTHIAESLGRPYSKHFGGLRLHGAGGPLDEAEVADWQAWSDAAFESVEALGAAGRDVAAREGVPAHPRWGGAFETWFAALAGTPPDMHSALDFARSAESPNNWPPVDGYGALVAAWGADVPVRLATPVHAVRRTVTGVEVETPLGTLRAGAAVLALPLGVLQAGTVRFDPPLPATMRAALEGLHPGYANKVALELEPDALGDWPDTSYLAFDDAGPTIRFQIRPFGRPLAIGYLAGRFAAEIEAEGPAAMAAFARDNLARALGSRVGRAVRETQTTSWLHGPLSRGAYSCALPGHAEARTLLQAPVDARLALAGEYAHTTLYGCVDGAKASGERAAAQMLDALGFRPAPPASARRA